MPTRTTTSLFRSFILPLVGAAVILAVWATVAPPVHAQREALLSSVVAGRYLVVFRPGTAMADVAPRLRRNGVNSVVAHTHLGTAAVVATAESARAIAADPAVESIVADRMVYAHAVLRKTVPQTPNSTLSLNAASPLRTVMVDPLAPAGTGSSTTATQPTLTDTFYQGSPQGWAVRAAGGLGAGVLGGTVQGPWNRTLGAGIRIAVLDSGIDSAHPDLAPNLAFNLSEIDTVAQPSACDDGSPQDQEGHGTWVASLAAGAMGADSGRIVGVAPAATLLNIKVLQRMPGTGSTVAAQCATGQAAGLVSWLLKGIDDAVQQHADVIVLSLGSTVDLYTGDGAGLKSAFDRVTHAAASAGVMIVAAAGNEAFDLTNPRYLELPAQARDVLAVVASTNPACAEDNRTGATCTPGVVTMPYYSNYGAPLLAIAAPGGNYPAGGDEAVSGWVRGACSSGKPNTTDGVPSDAAHSFGCFNLGHVQYVQAMGTSASAGLTGGAAALLRAAHPGWTPANVAAAMRSGTKLLGDGSVLLDTAAALQYQP